MWEGGEGNDAVPTGRSTPRAVVESFRANRRIDADGRLEEIGPAARWLFVRPTRRPPGNPYVVASLADSLRDDAGSHQETEGLAAEAEAER